jgi:ureidoglycolate hydrolase
MENKKYHTVGTVINSDGKIPHCQNSYKLWRKTKKYHTVGTVINSDGKTKKYHTVATVINSDGKTKKYHTVRTVWVLYCSDSVVFFFFH